MTTLELLNVTQSMKETGFFLGPPGNSIYKRWQGQDLIRHELWENGEIKENYIEVIRSSDDLWLTELQ